MNNLYNGKFTDISHGYIPNDVLHSMSYVEWCDTFGKYRWFYKDISSDEIGSISRTYYPLDYNWNVIYREVIRSCDIALSYKEIVNVVSFTDEFLSKVPLNWLKFKTQLELMTGDLSGVTIKPDMFNQGYERWTDSKLDNTYSEQSIGKNDTSSLNQSDVISHNDSNTKDDVKARQINYAQGVQAYPELSNDNIGELGINHASNFSDGITNSDGIAISNGTTNENTEFRSENNDNISNSGSANDLFNEHVKETRVNFYDNLAFLRTRIELMDTILPFDKMFEELFIKVNKFSSWW